MKKLLGILVLFFYSSLQAAEPITFSNIKSRIKDIPEVAYNNTQNLLNSNRAKSNSVKLEIHVGPNTKLYFKASLIISLPYFMSVSFPSCPPFTTCASAFIPLFVASSA